MSTALRANLTYRSFRRARRVAKKRELGFETFRPYMERDPAFIRNPHYGFRMTTAVYAEAIARTEEEIIPRLEKAVRNFFHPSGLKDERIRYALACL